MCTEWHFQDYTIELYAYVLSFTRFILFDTLHHGIMLHRLLNFKAILAEEKLPLCGFLQTFKIDKVMLILPWVTRTWVASTLESVIDPLTFTMYLSPVGDILRQHDAKYHLYADDIQIYLDFLLEGALVEISICMGGLPVYLVRIHLHKFTLSI